MHCLQLESHHLFSFNAILLLQNFHPISKYFNNVVIMSASFSIYLLYIYGMEIETYTHIHTHTLNVSEHEFLH